MGSLVKSMTGVFNPLAMPLAASGVIPIWGIVRHIGRKSGRSFATPIALTATREAFFVPLPWGQGTDWCRNLIAAGGGTIRYRGHDYAVREPQVVTADVATPAFPRLIRPILPVIGIRHFLKVRRAA